jgi:hypothetical protein
LVVEAATNETLCIEDGILRVEIALILSSRANQTTLKRKSSERNVFSVRGLDGELS